VSSRWKPGQSGNPAGRPKGSRDQLTESVYREFLEDWNKNGAAAIAKMRESKPELYVQAAIRLVPTHVPVDHEIEYSEATSIPYPTTEEWEASIEKPQ